MTATLAMAKAIREKVNFFIGINYLIVDNKLNGTIEKTVCAFCFCMSILGWTLKLFNKSLACRPKCYTLKYDAWGASLSSPSETAAKWRSSHLGLFFLQSQIFDKTKLSPFSGEVSEDDMKQLAFMVLALFYRLQSYKKKNLHVKEKMRFFIKRYKRI